MVTIDEIRALALSLPRTTEALVRDRMKLRVGRIVCEVLIGASRAHSPGGATSPDPSRPAT